MHRGEMPHRRCLIHVLHRAARFLKSVLQASPVITLSQKKSPWPENGLERRVSQFCTICAKNHPLNQKNKWESYGKFSEPDAWMSSWCGQLSGPLGLCANVIVGGSFFVWAVFRVTHVSTVTTVRSRKIISPIPKLKFWNRSLYGGLYGKPLLPGFPYNFTKNNRRDLKMGYIDASRRQLQSVLNIRV